MDILQIKKQTNKQTAYVRSGKLVGISLSEWPGSGILSNHRMWCSTHNPFAYAHIHLFLCVATTWNPRQNLVSNIFQSEESDFCRMIGLCLTRSDAREEWLRMIENPLCYKNKEAVLFILVLLLNDSSACAHLFQKCFQFKGKFYPIFIQKEIFFIQIRHHNY